MVTVPLLIVYVYSDCASTAAGNAIASQSRSAAAVTRPKRAAQMSWLVFKVVTRFCLVRQHLQAAYRKESQSTFECKGWRNHSPRDLKEQLAFSIRASSGLRNGNCFPIHRDPERALSGSGTT